MPFLKKNDVINFILLPYILKQAKKNRLFDRFFLALPPNIYTSFQGKCTIALPYYLLFMYTRH